MAVRKIKNKAKIVKEFVNTQFKEAEKEKDDGNNVEESEENEGVGNENGRFENGGGNEFLAGGERTAPVLQASNQQASQNLEQVARTAPPASRIGTEETINTGNQNLYAANYEARYSNENYETERRRDEEQVVIRPAVRHSGVLNDIRNFDTSELRRMQSAWQNQDAARQMAEQQQVVDGNLPDERRYHPREDQIKEQTKLVDKRRRMM